MEHLAHLAHPVVDIDFGTAHAPRRLTTHRDEMFTLATVETAVFARASLLGIPAPKHSPSKRGMEIMRPWPVGFHTWPSLWPQIWSTTGTDAHAYSIRPQKPSSVPQGVVCPQNQQSGVASAAKWRTIVPLGSSTNNGPVESETQSAGAWSTRLVLASLCASAHCRARYEWW